MLVDKRHINHRPSAEHLLSQEPPGIEMTSSEIDRSLEQGASASSAQTLDHEPSASKNQSRVQEQYTDHEASRGLHRLDSQGAALGGEIAHEQPIYKVYKRRWFGLIQLVLLNIVVSWDWLTYAPVTNSTATFFNTDPTIINWLSTAFLFAYVFASPFTLYTLHHSGPRLSIITASILILIGNWLRYAAMRIHPASFPLAMVAQIIIGLAQPFVLSAPTRYSDLWFSPRGRVSATAVASLANPFGGALGQLIDPFLVNVPSDIPNLTLYVAIISSVATIPSFFIPAGPPTPVSPSSTHVQPPIMKQVSLLTRSVNFWLLFLPFSVYVGFFNSLSSLLVQFLTPYNFSETDSGIAGALLIVVGLVAAAITSPIIDRSKRYLLLIKLLVPIIALSYLAFIWAPPSYSIVAPYLICSILGAASFSLVPVALEWLVEVNWPVGPEVGSVICWAGGQALGGIFIVISDALGEGSTGGPPYNMHKALIFQAVIAISVVPCALAIGWVGGGVRNRRLEFDKGTGDRSGGTEVGGM
ncbi:hypothetical protein MMC26_003763 [Xylographa opegraphella]|nr:hypothetical protein [Xylographa opegraphella]